MEEISVGHRIAKLRTERSLTQQQLADIISVSDKAINKWETGGCYPDITIIPELAKYFGVTTDYILCGTPRKQQKIISVPAFGNANRIDLNSINTEYLDKGWELCKVEVAGNEDLIAVVMVLERYVYE